jgi:acetyl-CoA carboxylase carboxyltransferase component
MGDAARIAIVNPRAAAAIVIAQAWNTADEHGRLRLDSEREDLLQRVRSEVRGEVARELDVIHTIERARRVGSVDRVMAAHDLRPELIAAVERGMESEGEVRAAAIDR